MAESGLGSVQYAVIDAFTDKPFRGNPAAVCLLEENKDTEWMQTVAAEFNLSETAFLRRRENGHQNGKAVDNDAEEFDLRWFTPVTEVDLCGHATLASAHFLFSLGLVNCNLVLFHTRSGVLTALKIEGINKEGQSFGTKAHRFEIKLNFPQVSLFDCDSSDIRLLSNSLKGLSVQSVKKTTDNDLFVSVFSFVPKNYFHTNIHEHNEVLSYSKLSNSPRKAISEDSSHIQSPSQRCPVCFFSCLSY